MLRVGIVGSENSHSLQFAKLMNIDRKIAGARAVAIWGEEPAKTQEVAGQTAIGEIVQRPEDLVGKVDVAIVDHRHARFHVPAATPLVKAGIPVLVDKPFSWTVAEGKGLLELAARKKVLVTSYSCVRYCDGFLKDQKAMKSMGALTSVDYFGPCDIDSIYGGIFFYGIHQVEMMVAHLGIDIESVQFSRGNGSSHTATVFYKSGLVVTLHLLKDFGGGFQYTFCGAKEVKHFALDYTGLYEKGLKAFFRMLKSGKNDHGKRELLAPVAVLEALAKSIKSGKREKLAKF